MNALNNVPVWMHLYFWIGVAMVLIQVFIGMRQWRKVRYGVVRRQLQYSEHPDIAIDAAAAIGGVLFSVFYMVEEGANIEAWHVAGAAVQHADAALTAGVGLVLAFVVAAAAAAAVLHFVGHVASCAQKGRLQIQMEEDPQRDAVRDAQRRQRRQRADARRGVESPQPRSARQQVPRHREVTSVTLRPR